MNELDKIINTKREYQCDQILNHLMANGSITSDEGLALFGCRRTAARIYDLRKYGWQIDTVMVGTDQKYGRYFLNRKESQVEMQA